MAPSATSPAGQNDAAARAAAAAQYAEAKNNQKVDKKADKAWAESNNNPARKSDATDAKALDKMAKKELSPAEREHYVRTCLGDSEFAKTAQEYDTAKEEFLSLKAGMPADLAKQVQEIKDRPFHQVKEANGQREPLRFRKHRQELIANIEKEYAERISSAEQRVKQLNMQRPVQIVRGCGERLKAEGYLSGEVTFSNVQAALLDKDIGVAPQATQAETAPQASAQVPGGTSEKPSSPQATAEKAEGRLAAQSSNNPWEAPLTPQEAEKLNKDARELYGKSEYREAAGIFKDLYNKTGQAKYLHNAVYAYEGLGDDFTARKLGKEYVGLVGVSAEDKEKVNQHIASMEARLPARSLKGLSPEFLKPDTIVHIKETYKHVQTGELFTDYHTFAAADVYKFDESKNPPVAVGILLSNYANNEVTFEDPTTGRTQQATVKASVGEEISQLTFSKPQEAALPIDEAGKQYDALIDEAAPIHKKIAELSAKKAMLESALKSSKNERLNNNLQKQITSLQTELKTEQGKIDAIQKRINVLFEKNPELKKLLATDYQHYDYNGRLSTARYQGVKDYVLGESRDRMRQIQGLVESGKGEEAKNLAIQFFRQNNEPDYLIYYMACKEDQYQELNHAGTKEEVVKAKNESIKGILDDFEEMSKLGLSPQIKSKLVGVTYSVRSEDLDPENSGRLLKVQKENMDSVYLVAAAKYSHDDSRANELALRALEVAKNEEERQEAVSLLAVRTAHSIVQDKDLSWKDLKDLRAKINQVPGLSKQDREAALKEMDQVFTERARRLNHEEYEALGDAKGLYQIAKNFEEIYNLSSKYDDLHNALLLYGEAGQKDAHFIQLLDKAMKDPNFNTMSVTEQKQLNQLKSSISK